MQRFRGCLLGLAVGDAVGTTVEFSPPGSFAPVTDMVGGGPFGLPPGAWTDDTSMAMCLAESVLETRKFDPVDQLERYVRWWRDGHWSSTGTCFDIGNATRAALQRFVDTGEPFPGDAAPNAAGNGPLMKLAPVPMAWANDPDLAARYAGESARTTHGAPEAVDATRLFAQLLIQALHGAPRRNLLHRRERTGLHPKVAAVAAGSYLDKRPPEIRGTGYIVDALEAALWALASTRTSRPASWRRSISATTRTRRRRSPASSPARTTASRASPPAGVSGCTVPARSSPSPTGWRSATEGAVAYPRRPMIRTAHTSELDQRRLDAARALLEEAIIRSGYDFGALGSSDEGLPFYTGRGWEPWRGTLRILTLDGIEETPDELGWILVFGGGLDLDGDLLCADVRPGDIW